MKFNDLCPQHRNDLLALAKRYTGQEHTAEDLVQEAMFRAYNFWAQFNQETDDINRDVRVWLRRILSNIFYSQYSKDQRRAQGFELYENQVDVDLQEDATNADLDKVREVIGTLKPEYQEIIDLHYSSGLSYQELSDRLGIPFTKVQKRLWRARQIMKDRLLKAGFVNTSAFKAPEAPQTDSDSIDGVVGGDDTITFLDGETTPDTLSAW